MKFLFCFLLACLPLSAADWTLPATNQWSWTPGTDVGVTGGYEQYRTARPAAPGNLLDVTLAPYYLNLAYPTTTGTVSAGSSSLTVASATGFRVNDFVQLAGAWPEVSTLVVTAEATADGNVGIYLSGTIFPVAVLDTDTINGIATKLRAATYTGWTTSGSGDTVIFTSSASGNEYATFAIIGSPAGFAGTVSTVEGGSYGEHQITAISGNTLTITPARIAAAGVTDGALAIDHMRSLRAAVTDATDGDVIYCPAGVYPLTSELALTHDKDGITFRGDGWTTIFEVAEGAKGFNTYVGTDWEAGGATVSGTKTKGTATLTVSSITGFTVGQLVRVVWENEENNSRIQAGAPPTWTQKGFRDAQHHVATVTAVAGSTLALDPPLPMDATYRALRVQQMATSPYQVLERVGFEDFQIRATTSAGLGWGIIMTRMRDSWCHNLKITESGNHCIQFDESQHCEIRKCYLGVTTEYSSDGLIGATACVQNVIEDNIGRDANYMVYDDGNSVGNFAGYNYLTNVSGLWLSHGAHPCQNLMEGNVGAYYHGDAYHGSGSNSTVFRNWMPSVILNRFHRQYAIAGNVFGRDGVTGGGWSMGNPDMANGNANGFAGPTGTSVMAGTYDYQQNWGSFNTHQIQAGDIAAGDFWADWKLTGTVTNRVSDSVATITMNSSIGQMFVGQGFYNNGPAVWWDSYANKRTNTEVTAISGLDVTLGNTSFIEGIAFPANGTVVNIWPGTGGFQERDLDVEASLTLADNYFSAAVGTGAIRNGTADTLPASLAYTAKPAWFGSLTWPPVNPDSPTFSVEIIPAGYRYINDAAPPPSSTAVTVSGNATVGGTLSIGN